MALALSYEITENMADGSKIFFVDDSKNYGLFGNIGYSDVKAVRLYFGVYANQVSPTTLVFTAPMDQWREYQKTSLASSTYDNKVIQLGQAYIPFITGLTVLNGDVFVTTGRWSKYISPATYLPTSAKNTLTLAPADLGLSELVFPDGVYYLTYEVYVATSPSPIVNLVANTQYMVYGAGTCTYNGNIYRTGEVFIASDTNAVSFMGGAVLVQLSAITFRYFSLTFSVETQIATLILELSRAFKCNDDLMYQIQVMRSKLEAIKDADIMDKTDAALAQQLIYDIQLVLAAIYNQML